MKKLILLAVLVMAVGALTGCSTIMPYESEFSCPNADKGKCVSVYEAQRHAVETSRSSQDDIESGLIISDPMASAVQSESLDELVDKLEACSERGQSNCAKETRKEINKKIKEIKGEGNKRENKKSLQTQEMARIDALRDMVRKGETDTPVRTPAIMMELYIAPYETKDGVLAGARNMWFVVREAQWVFGDPLEIKDTEYSIGKPMFE